MCGGVVVCVVSFVICVFVCFSMRVKICALLVCVGVVVCVVSFVVCVFVCISSGNWGLGSHTSP